MAKITGTKSKIVCVTTPVSVSRVYGLYFVLFMSSSEKEFGNQLRHLLSSGKLRERHLQNIALKDAGLQKSTANKSSKKTSGRHLKNIAFGDKRIQIIKIGKIRVENVFEISYRTRIRKTSIRPKEEVVKKLFALDQNIQQTVYNSIHALVLTSPNSLSLSHTQCHK